jgi:hypothetical protein
VREATKKKHPDAKVRLIEQHPKLELESTRSQFSFFSFFVHMTTNGDREQHKPTPTLACQVTEIVQIISEKWKEFDDRHSRTP